MIARNNERTIGPALCSVRRWVDEMIVVDTGSTDRTVDVARELGALVYEESWRDDFSAARNSSLARASGYWVFWMDTDDVLPDLSGPALRKLIAGEVEPNVMGFVLQVHCPSPRGRGIDVTSVDHVKLIRNRPDIRFEGRVHEQILPSIRRIGGHVAWTSVVVEHANADHTPEGFRRKLDRDLRLLSLELQERPDHPFVLFNLGMTLLALGENLRAFEALHRCIAYSQTTESHTRKAYALSMEALLAANRLQQARRLAWEGVGRFPDDIELQFRLGRIYVANDEVHSAIECFERLLNSARGPRRFSSTDVKLQGYKAMANLAKCYAIVGRMSDAEKLWRDAVDDEPRSEESWMELARLLLAQDRGTELTEYCRQASESAESNVGPLLALAVAHEQRGSSAEARTLYVRAIESDVNSVNARNEYARYLFSIEAWADAAPVISKLKELDPSNPSVHHNWGQLLIIQGRHEEAVEAFRLSLALRPAHQPTMRLLKQALEACPSARSTRSVPSTDLDSPTGGKPHLGTPRDIA